MTTKELPQRGNVLICSRCHTVHEKDVPFTCGCTAKLYPMVKTGDLYFARMSSIERETSLGGRHFFAMGADSRGYTLFEHDQPIVLHGTCRPVGRKFERLLNSKALAAEIRRLVETGEKLPTDCRPPWEIDEARHRASQAELEAQRPDNKRPRIHDCGARY